MLPFFTSVHEVDLFLQYLPTSVMSILLFENYQSLALAKQITEQFKIDEVFIGLNDLALSLHNKSIFTVFRDSAFYDTLQIFKNAGIPYGLGGVGNMLLENLPVQPDLFFLFQLCLGCERGLLSRNFRSIFSMDNWEEVFQLNMNIIGEKQKLFSGFSEVDRKHMIREFKENVASLHLANDH
jgi:hypothetical protein